MSKMKKFLFSKAAETAVESAVEEEDAVAEAGELTGKAVEEIGNTVEEAAEEIETAAEEVSEKEEDIPDAGKTEETSAAEQGTTKQEVPMASAEDVSDDNIMEKWYRAAQKRVSMRSFSGTPEIPVLRALRQAAQMVSTEEARIYVGKRPGIFDPLIKKVITGTDAFAAVILRGKDKYMAGFVGEAFLLECESMGLGTCWLGASYSHSVAKAAVKLRQGEKIVCLIAIGKYDDTPDTVGARKSIFSLTGMEDETFCALPEWQQCAVRCARIAPSARNAQPWEFDVINGGIQVAITSSNMGFSSIDCGIAMLHIELGAAHCGKIGDWSFDDGYPIFRIAE